nr:hypothetical protein chloroplast RF20 [Picochlorum sp. 'soloecismus']
MSNFSLKITKKLFIFFISFCIGNIFGLMIKTSTNQFQYMIGIICCFEIISLFNSKKDKLPVFFNVLNIMNSIKRGFLLGIFVEAFKVGS